MMCVLPFNLSNDIKITSTETKPLSQKAGAYQRRNSGFNLAASNTASNMVPRKIKEISTMILLKRAVGEQS